MEFGLTYKEAILFNPLIHQQPDKLWITREIAHNSHDRFIPIRWEEQLNLLKLHTNLTNDCHPLKEKFEQQFLRASYQHGIKLADLSSAKSYRGAYARKLYQELTATIDAKATKTIIMREMGITAKSTLWEYFNE